MPWPPAHCPSRVPNTSWTPGRLGKPCASLLLASTTTTCSQASSPSPWWASIATLLCATQSRRWSFVRQSRQSWSTCLSGFSRLRLGCPLWSWLWPKWQIMVRQFFSPHLYLFFSNSICVFHPTESSLKCTRRETFNGGSSENLHNCH